MTEHTTQNAYTPHEMMCIVSSRFLKNDDVCFVGVGVPSAACNLARLTHAPDITLIYESGPIGTKPNVLPLSIGDTELNDTALVTVPITEMFPYWIHGGHIKIAFLGAAQMDKYSNINTTVIGDYDNPKVRLPGGGGAPEIAAHAQEIFMIMPQSKRRMVEKIDFYTSFGHGTGGNSREKMGLKTKGPTLLITDLAVWQTDPFTKELTVMSLHPGVTKQQMQENCGWDITYSPDLITTPTPTAQELSILRDMRAKAEKHHNR